MATLTNLVAAQALRGQKVKVTIASAGLATLSVGQLCTVDSSSEAGYIASVDYDGTSFLVAPRYPSGKFQTSAGYLNASATITV